MPCQVVAAVAFVESMQNHAGSVSVTTLIGKRTHAVRFAPRRGTFRASGAGKTVKAKPRDPYTNPL